jgi:hypothetical protein
MCICLTRGTCTRRRRWEEFFKIQPSPAAVKAPYSTHNTTIWSQVPLAPNPTVKEACQQFGNLFRKSEHCSFRVTAFSALHLLKEGGPLSLAGISVTRF